MRLFLLGSALLSLSACELLNGGLNPAMPSLAYQDSALVQSPSQRMMEAYYCPEVVPDPFGVPGSAQLLCSGFFGGAPAQSEMNVGFRTRYGVKNPNEFPIPLAELLTAVTVFPDKTNQSLGATCVVFCGEGDPSCTGAAGPGSCQSSDSDVRSVDDFVDAAGGLLISSGIQLAAGETPGFRRPEVNANAESTLAALFAFGPDPLLKTLEQLAVQSVDQLAAGQSVTFEVPFRLEGTVWFDVGSLGKVALGFGPVDGTFLVPTEKLVPDF